MASETSKRFKPFYENEAAVYHETRYGGRYGRLFRKLHHELIEDELTRLPSKSMVLEVACGTGHVTSLLSNHDLRLFACDLTRPMMEQSRQRTLESQSPPDFVETNAKHLPFADNSFDMVISTRFLHLFPPSEQEILLGEMLRVLKPNGKLVVDFDNWSSRWLFAIPYLLYNIARYQRLAPYSIYNRVTPTARMLQQLGLNVLNIYGVGGTHLVLPAYISENLASRLGRAHRSPPLRTLAEQFMIIGTKR
jgi:ubiquinone/menaquinone biosynthesis C-methylase UbiE